jgi:hypothetical protein
MTQKEAHQMMSLGAQQGLAAGSSCFDGQLARLGGVGALQGMMEQESKKTDEAAAEQSDNDNDDNEGNTQPGKKGRKRGTDDGGGGLSGKRARRTCTLELPGVGKGLGGPKSNRLYGAYTPKD